MAEYESIVPMYTIKCCECGRAVFDNTCMWPSISEAIDAAVGPCSVMYSDCGFREHYRPGEYICAYCDLRTYCANCDEVMPGYRAMRDDGLCSKCAAMVEIRTDIPKG